MTPHLLTPTSQIRLNHEPGSQLHPPVHDQLHTGTHARLYPTWHHSQTNDMHILWIKQALGKICDHHRVVLVVRLTIIFIVDQTNYY
jgi:hypothetical protein